MKSFGQLLYLLAQDRCLVIVQQGCMEGFWGSKSLLLQRGTKLLFMSLLLSLLVDRLLFK